MPQSTASEFSLFEEIYGSYFQAVRRILEAGHDTPLTLTDLYQLVRSCAFEESAAAIVPKLTDGPWAPLLEKVEEGNEFIPQLEDIYIIKEIDDKFIYLIKNGENKIVKFNKIQGDYSPLDLVYCHGDKLIKDQTFTKYFNEFLSKFNQKVSFDKNNFKMHRYLVENFLDHGVSLCELNDIHALTFIPDYELNGNYVTGDIYIKIELGRDHAYIYEDDLSELHVTYNQVLMRDQSPDDKMNDFEVVDFLDKLVKQTKAKRKKLIKVSKKAEEYYAAHPLPYSKEDIIGTYQIMELEFDHVYRLSNCNQKNDFNNYVDEKELPPNVREGDEVVLVQDKETNQKKYYFTRKHYKNSFDYDLKLTEETLNAYKQKIKHN